MPRKSTAWKNPVTEEIASQRSWNSLDQYMPRIVAATPEPDQLFHHMGVEAILPGKVYEKWISKVTGSKYFRDIVERDIRNIFYSRREEWPTRLIVHWSNVGAGFETDGVNGCVFYLEYDHIRSRYRYTEHNVDNYAQASVLFIALSTYLRHMYRALEELEAGDAALILEDSKPLSDRNEIDTEIAIGRSARSVTRLRRRGYATKG